MDVFGPPAASLNSPNSRVAEHHTNETASPYKQWDHIIHTFLKSSGLIESAKAFELDILMMSPQFERERIPVAISELLKDLTMLGQLGQQQTGKDRELEERKTDYVTSTQVPQSRTSYNRTISRFLAQSRARNDASNRTEFLRQTLTSKPPPAEGDDISMDDPEPDPFVHAMPYTSARTDAKSIDRDLQMPFDIVKNVEGPLRRTTGTEKGKEREARDAAGQGSGGMLRATLTPEGEPLPTMERHPGLEQRFLNIEEHFAVRYVPGPPEDLRLRIKALEDHLIRLEKEYPPWAALHFNQPRRGWPPPPRTTPIVVPSHLTALEPEPSTSNEQSQFAAALRRGTGTHQPANAKAGSSKPIHRSSLHRAVLEKLEVQEALNELKAKR